MDVGDDDNIVVTLVPRHQGPGVTIGGIKIIETPVTTTASSSFSSVDLSIFVDSGFCLVSQFKIAE